MANLQMVNISAQHFHIWQYLGNNRGYLFTMITSFIPIMYHSCRCFQTTIYSLQKFSSDILLILPPLEFLQIIHHHYHGNCRILADGPGIFNLECCYCFTSILDRRPQSNYPRHSFRMCLHHLLLDTYEPHTIHLSEDVLFGCFVIALNAAFTQQLSLVDEGYKSGSDTVDPVQPTVHCKPLPD